MTNPFDQLPFPQPNNSTHTATPEMAPEAMTQPMPAAAPAPMRPGWPIVDQPLMSGPTPTMSAPATAIPEAAPVTRTEWRSPLPATEQITRTEWRAQPPVSGPTAAVPAHVALSDLDIDVDELDQDDDDQGDQPRTLRRRSGLARVVRRILGLDRAPSRKNTTPGSDWLDEEDEDNDDPGAAAVAAPIHDVPLAATGVGHDREPATAAVAPLEVGDVQTTSRPRRQRRQPAAATSVAVSESKPDWGARIGKYVIWGLVAIIFAAGLNSIVRSVLGTRNPAIAEQGTTVDQSAAQAAAVRYSLDYFSYSPDTAAAGATALRADVDSTTVKRWTGTGYLAADSAVAGPIVTIDDTTALVPVTLRIRLAMPPARDTEPAAPAAPTSETAPSNDGSAPASPEPVPSTSRPRPSAASAAPTVPGGAAGDPGQIPSGWTDLGSRWVTVSVPVRAGADGSIKATGGGAVLVGEVVDGTIGRVDPMADSDQSTTTQTAVERFFTGYAASDTAYVSAPGVDMTGLSEVVTVTGQTRWSADMPATDGTNSSTPLTATELTGTAAVTWQLTGTDLSIVQTYRAAMTLSQGRWYVAQLAPSLTNQ